MSRSIVLVSVCIFVAWLLGQSGYGQTGISEAKVIEQKFAEVWNKSKATIRQYTWKARTEVRRDNELMQVMTEQVSYGSGGREIRSVISNQEAPLPSAPVIRDIAENKKSKIVAFMTGLRTFLEQYALDGDSLRTAFFSKADISGPDDKGLIQVSGADVLAGGDRLKWWIDTRSFSIAYATVATTFEDTHIEFSATYYLLPGLNYMSQARIMVPVYDMLVTLKFYDYVKR